MASNSICLVISHYIFLDRVERYSLHDHPGTVITTTGWFVPVWSNGLPKKGRRQTTSEPAGEIICRYTVTNQRQETLIEVEKPGFKVSLASKNTRIKLLDPKDMGAGSVNFAYKARWEIGGTIYPVLSFVNISEISILLRTLV